VYNSGDVIDGIGVKRCQSKTCLEDVKEDMKSSVSVMRGCTDLKQMQMTGYLVNMENVVCMFVHVSSVMVIA